MKVAPRSFSLIMARVPAMCFQEEKKGRLLLSLVNTNMKVFVIMLKRYRGRCSLVVILALILFFFQFSSLKSYTIHKYEICPESKKKRRGYKGSIFAFCKYLFAAPPSPPPPSTEFSPWIHFHLFAIGKAQMCKTLHQISGKSTEGNAMRELQNVTS